MMLYAKEIIGDTNNGYMRPVKNCNRFKGARSLITLVKKNITVQLTTIRNNISIKNLGLVIIAT